jgi:hypothetical protein
LNTISDWLSVLLKVIKCNKLLVFSYLMVAGAIDWNICPEVLGMAKGYIALEGWPRAI